MFKDLYGLSKTGEITQMKNMLEETLSKHEAQTIVSIPQSPNLIYESAEEMIQEDFHMEVSSKTSNGSKKLKELGKRSTKGSKKVNQQDIKTL